jgi:hypothetical protein
MRMTQVVRVLNRQTAEIVEAELKFDDFGFDVAEGYRYSN